MKIEINVSLDTIEDKDIGTELLEVLIALKERIDLMNDEED
tara:strand:+ start:645 stop:767 length:123 start_codon:yes stop_codon:yes gene_type:complete